MLPHRSIHKYTWTSPDGKTHNQIHHILIDRRRHSSILDDRSFRGADCDSDHYLVVARVRERLAVGKQLVKKMDVERFNVKKLNEVEVKEQYQVTIKNQKERDHSEDQGVDRRMGSEWILGRLAGGV
jgi:hypothetical protein